MAYTPTVWKNGEFPPIDAEHLNKIEQGIANSAPGGFGLGELTGRTANSFADITGYGFYRVPSESGFAPDTSSNWGAVYIGASLSYGTLLYARNNALMAVRAVSGGEVGPIEWINPPMELGVEYRTTERHLGKPVYTQIVQFDNLSTSQSFAPGGEIFRAIGEYQYPDSSGKWIPNMPTDTLGEPLTGDCPYMYFGSNYNFSIRVQLKSDAGCLGKSARVQMWYTK